MNSVWIVVVLGWGVRGFAQDGPSADVLLAQALAAERGGQAQEEHDICRRLVDAYATGRAVARCEGRLEWLEARRDMDGSLHGLQRLEAARRSGSVSDVEALAADPGIADLVRWETWDWLARHHLRLHQADVALQWSDPLWDALRDRKDLSRQRRQAADLHSRALATAGRTDDALAVEAIANPARSSVPREGPAQVIRIQRRERLASSSWVGVGVFGGVGLPLATLGWLRRPRPRPVGLALIVVMGVAFGAIGVAWDASLLAAFAALTAALGAVHLISAGGALFLKRRWQRVAWGAMSAATTVALGYLVLHLFELLASVGL